MWTIKKPLCQKRWMNAAGTEKRDLLFKTSHFLFLCNASGCKQSLTGHFTERAIAQLTGDVNEHAVYTYKHAHSLPKCFCILFFKKKSLAVCFKIKDLHSTEFSVPLMKVEGTRAKTTITESQLYVSIHQSYQTRIKYVVTDREVCQMAQQQSPEA